MGSTDFSIDLRDMRFVLQEQLGAANALAATERYADYDEEMFDSLLDEAARLSVEVLAPLNGPGEREGCRLQDGQVRTPTGFKEAYAQYAEGGWVGLTGPAEHGGMGAPRTVHVAIKEMTQGANMALSTYPGLTAAAASMVARFASPALAEICCPRMLEGKWGGTMCLTEAGAGTDVGAVRTRAVSTDEPGVFALEGEKIFITAGDSDLTDNVIHLVLARTPDSQPGIKGLSLFLVPKVWFDSAGELGDSNHVEVANLEHKMGLHASATCVLVFGGSRGWMLGEEGQGIRLMFHMMNAARLSVGIQGLSGAAAATQYALGYVHERVQGGDLTNHKGPAVPIVQHPDVRRMLMDMRTSTELMRSLLYTVALQLDLSQASGDAQARERLGGLVELLTPICKAYCTDLGLEVCGTGLQVFGGYGYTAEYPLEQLVREAKAGAIYEGTNGVQAMDLLGRKLRQNNGALLGWWLQESRGHLEEARKHDELTGLADQVDTALGGVMETAVHLGGRAIGGNVKGAFLFATPFLEQFGITCLAVHALWQARIALDADPTGTDPFYRAKVLNARWWVAHRLPAAQALAVSIQSGEEAALDECLFG